MMTNTNSLGRDPEPTGGDPLLNGGDPVHISIHTLKYTTVLTKGQGYLALLSEKRLSSERMEVDECVTSDL